MDDYVERMINEFSIKISKINTALTPDGNNIFEKGNIKRLGKKETEEFHASLSRGIFVVSRAIPDILQTVVVLSTMVIKNLMILIGKSWLE